MIKHQTNNSSPVNLPHLPEKFRWALATRPDVTEIWSALLTLSILIYRHCMTLCYLFVNVWKKLRLRLKPITAQQILSFDLVTSDAEYKWPSRLNVFKLKLLKLNFGRAHFGRAHFGRAHFGRAHFGWSHFGLSCTAGLQEAEVHRIDKLC